MQQWSELDNVIYDELLEYFGQGLRPQRGDVDRLVREFKDGKFRYNAFHGGEEDEDANKDDGSAAADAKLPGWG